MIWRGRAAAGVTRADARHRGQSLVEFALILPTMLLMLVGLIDFGFLFYTNMTLEYATREGARVGSALAAGNGHDAALCRGR